MKKISLIAFAALVALCSCSKQSVDPFRAGVCIGYVEVGSAAGQLSVSVETANGWSISCPQEWLHFDVTAGEGNSAFTAYFTSNESDILSLRHSRVAKVAVRLHDGLVADTLYVCQHGFINDPVPVKVETDPAIRLEVDTKAVTTLEIVCCNSDGASQQDVVDWACGTADVALVDGKVYGEAEDMGFAACDYAGLDAEQEYEAFKQLIRSTLNDSANNCAQWVIGGSMYHLSMMQTGYASTPAWYPADALSDDFRSDRYAWQNNLSDVLWMKNKDYIVTYSDGQGHAWAADYVYVSASVLAKVVDAALVDAPVAGMTHKAIRITLKY